MLWESVDVSIAEILQSHNQYNCTARVHGAGGEPRGWVIAGEWMNMLILGASDTRKPPGSSSFIKVIISDTGEHLFVSLARRCDNLVLETITSRGFPSWLF